jgi:hypothetical protein
MSGASVLGRNGAALTLPWTPQFDLDQQIDAWTLDITTVGGAPVKSISGSGPTDALRGISWDGKSTGGVIAAPGAYRWTLTGSKGAGTLTNSTGGAVTGTLTVVSTVKSAVTIKETPSTVVYGSETTVTARLVKAGTTVGIAADDLTLLGRKRGTTAWTDLGTATTNATGYAVFSPRPIAHWQFASVSSAVTVLSKLRLSAIWGASTVKHGKTVLIRGAVAPAVAGQKVVVQRLVGTRWVAVKTITVVSGAYSSSIAVGSKLGTFSFRVTKAADSGHLATVSVVKKIKVT